jgi:hypothetical protein
MSAITPGLRARVFEVFGLHRAPGAKTSTEEVATTTKHGGY